MEAPHDQVERPHLHQIIVSRLADCQIEFALRFNDFEDAEVQSILTERILQIVDRRATKKALDFDSDLSRSTLGRKQSFRRQIYEQILRTLLQQVRIRRDGPSLLEKRVLHRLMNDILPGHKMPQQLTVRSTLPIRDVPRLLYRMLPGEDSAADEGMGRPK